MEKRKLIEQIKEHLSGELIALEGAAQAAHEAATHEESKPEDQYDTRGLEASYLANAQTKRAEEIRNLLLMYKFLPIREYGANDVVCPASLVELEYNSTRAYYFVVPNGGGLITRVDDMPVQVITPASPMGEALLGKKIGETIEVETRNGTRNYKIISLQ